jgi:microcystin-dependent protein
MYIHCYQDALWDTRQGVTTGTWDAANDDVDDMTRTTELAGSHAHTVSGTTSSVGGGNGHENRPPYCALTFIMHVGD